MSEILEEKQEEKKNIKSYIRHFLKDKTNLLFLIVLLVAFIIRMYYFFATANQALWWDESEYAMMAKHLALNTPLSGWEGIREMGFPVFLSLFFKLGGGVGAIKIFEILCSLGTITLTYFLGKEFFNKKIALVASLLMSFFYLELFYNYRVLLQAPATFLVILGMYLFWKGYTNKNMWFYSLSFIIFLSGIYIYSIIFAGAAVVILFLLIVERQKIFKNKVFLKSLIPTGIVAAIAFSYNIITSGHLIPRLAYIGPISEGGKAIFNWGNIFDYILLLPTYLKIPLLLAFIVGLYLFVDIFIGFDLIKENKNVQRSLFIALWIVIFLVVITYNTIVSHTEPRYFLQAFPVIFMVVAFGIFKISELISKKSPKLAVIVLLAFIISGIYFQAAFAHDLIMSKKDSYLEVKEAGLWFNENTEPGEYVVSTSLPQTVFYSERPVFHPNYVNNSQDLDRKITELNARYFQLSVYERMLPHYQEYIEAKNPAVAKTFYRDNQAIVVIYDLGETPDKEPAFSFIEDEDLITVS